MTAIDLNAVRFLGSGLSRPECVVAHQSGLLFAPDWTEPGGVAAIAPNGGVMRFLATQPDPEVDAPIRPNGIALEPGGSFLIAHLGADRGGVYRLFPNGRCEVVADKIAGDRMPPANFVAIDEEGRLWITVSTRKTPRAKDYRPGADSGYLAVLEPGETEARIAADYLGYANECLLAPDGGTVWVNETFGRRTLAFDRDGDKLTNKRVVTEYGAGDFPDGIALAEDGTLLVVSIVSNRVLEIAPSGERTLWLEDAEQSHLDWVEEAFQSSRMGRPHLDANPSKRLRNVSNIAFGGVDRRTAYLGCLLGDRIATFDAPIAGAPLKSWDVDLGPLAI